MTTEANDPLQPHVHEPNPTPPSSDTSFMLIKIGGKTKQVTVNDLSKMEKTVIPNCYIVSTGHGTSGPFAFGGVTLEAFMKEAAPELWSQVEIVSADGFGNRVFAEEVMGSQSDRPILLAYEIDERPLTRQQGCVRLIVPSETDDALRQVKWIGEIRIRP